MQKSRTQINIPLPQPLYRGKDLLRIALVGMPDSGKSTLFQAVSSTSVQTGELSGTNQAYRECAVQIGLEQARLIDLPSIHCLHDEEPDDLVTLKYLLWGADRPPVSVHEPDGPPAPFSPPDLIIQVIDATVLEHQLELTLELSQLGRPLLVALNRLDEARERGLNISHTSLSRQLDLPVVPTVALMGHGIAELFSTAVDVVRKQKCPLPPPPSQHICDSLIPLSQELNTPEILHAFRVPHSFLLMQLAQGSQYIQSELQQHFPDRLPRLLQLRAEAENELPRTLVDEIHADRHHRAATIFEAATRIGSPHQEHDWKYWLDALFLHPHWGLMGSLGVFAIVLFMVFEVSSWLDSMTAAQLLEWTANWQPEHTLGVIGRAVLDGLIGLVGIVIPYMIPLVIFLVALEQIGIMQRIAFVVDRGFHQIGLHGGVAVPFLLGLGCNVPAISSMARITQGRERFIASVLVTFVPCSARSAIILALAGKYLGGLGVFAIFALTLLVIAVMGNLLSKRFRQSGPGQVQEIPAYALPHWRSVFHETWERTRDILTIVTPLLIGGSILLALLGHIGADQAINTLFSPITHWWLGLPVVLGVPILFGILRKELSLLMIYQALGTFDIDLHMNWIQITTFLLFLTFYIPCVSTFATMIKTINTRNALLSIAMSVAVALFVSGVIRWILELVNRFSAV